MAARASDRAVPDFDLDRASAVSRRPAAACGRCAGSEPVAAARLARAVRVDVQRGRRGAGRTRRARLRRSSPRCSSAYPLVRSAFTLVAFDRAMEEGLGRDYLEQIRPPAKAVLRGHAFSPMDFVRGIGRVDVLDPPRSGVCQARRSRADRRHLSAAGRRSASRAAAVVRWCVAARGTEGQRVVCKLVRLAGLPRRRDRLPACSGRHVACADPGRPDRARMGARAQQ